MDEWRTWCWRQVGDLAAERISPLLGPAYLDQPRWPRRPAFRLIDLAGEASVVATDGLTDALPSDDPRWDRRPGFGVECFVRSNEQLTPGDVGSSWQLALMIELGQRVAGDDDVRRRLVGDDVIVVTVDLPAAPETHRVRGGRLPVLLGAEDSLVPGKLRTARGDQVRLVSAVPLDPVQAEAAGRNLRARRRLATQLGKRRGGAIAMFAAVEERGHNRLD